MHHMWTDTAKCKHPITEPQQKAIRPSMCRKNVQYETDVETHMPKPFMERQVDAKMQMTNQAPHMETQRAT